MDYIKNLFLSRFKTIALISIAMVLSIFLLMIRMKLKHSFHFLFLVWNLFLAVIPFAITNYLLSSPKLNKIRLAVWFGVWLLFLPNAPYIITDLIHLTVSYGSYVWLDILVVSSFAMSGLLLFYLSFLDMKNVLKPHLKNHFNKYFFILIIYLSSFGVYLGRFLRYNSWEILSNPKYLFIDILNIITRPLAYKEAWLFTIIFGLFLHAGLWIFNQFSFSANLKPDSE